MNKSELINLLYSNSEEELYIEKDGYLYEIEIGHQEEQFDGFDTVYPACIVLKPQEDERP